MTGAADLETLARVTQRVRQNVERVIEGKPDVVSAALVVMLAEGHLLIEDVPGVGKTMLSKALARSIDCSVRRIQFTPDLLPSDVTGVSIFNQDTRQFEFRPGGVFANIVLGDEINRASPKTQSALLECMEERQVTVDNTTYQLEAPFMVVATQNPIEQQGTYPLPEAQLDRFLFKHILKYPTEAEEIAIVTAHGARTGSPDPAEMGVSPAADAASLAEVANAVSNNRLTPEIIAYVVKLIRATRETPDIETGASPRSAAMLASAARARAALDGRDYVIPDDVKALALPALRHRTLLSPAAEIEGRTTDSVIKSILDRTEAPR